MFMGFMQNVRTNVVKLYNMLEFIAVSWNNSS